MKYSIILLLLFLGAHFAIAQVARDHEGPVLTQEAWQEYQIGVTIGPGVNDAQVYAPMDGTLVRFSKEENNPSGFGRFIELEHVFEYYFDGKRRHFTLYSILANLAEVHVSDIGQELNAGDVLGSLGATHTLFSTDDLVFCLYASELNLYFSYLTGTKPHWSVGYYWYSPNKLFFSEKKPFDYFQFYEIELPKGLFSFHNRLLQENRSSKNTLYFFNHIRFPLTLPEQPQSRDGQWDDLLSESRLTTEIEIRSLYTHFNDIQLESFRLIIFWQQGFDNYLLNEYRVGEELHIYGYLFAYDDADNSFYFLARDFNFERPENLVRRIYGADDNP
jgi:hypothetical protein